MSRMLVMVMQKAMIEGRVTKQKRNVVDDRRVESLFGLRRSRKWDQSRSK